MITLKRTLEDQKDLYSLCKRRGNPTVDAFRGNGFYGMGDIYKTFAQYPIDKPLNGVIPHGVSMDSQWFWKEEAHAPVPYIYCYPEFRKEVYKKHTNKEVILSASPYVYVVKMIEEQEKPQRRGTLFFPVHSSKQVIVQQNYEKLADKLLNLPRKYQPVDVCVYWVDFLLGITEPFRDRGINIVSAGHRYDHLFLYRLYHLLSQYSYISGNRLGSYLFYGVKTGCAFFYLDFEHAQIASSTVLKRNGCGIKSKRRNTIARVFKPDVNEPTPKQLRVVDYYLGVDYLKTEEELRRELLA